MTQIDTAGAPTDQGQAQGQALRLPIVAHLDALRRRQGWLQWLGARRFVRRTGARALATQLPWQHERLEGIARAARVSLGALQVSEALLRVQGSGYHDGATLQACLEIPHELEPLLTLRTSRPDAGGFPSAELTCASWAGCLAGVNAEGLGVICLEDRDTGQASLRFLAQEFLFRARDLTAGIDHLRRRGSYLGGTGRLLVGDTEGRCRSLSFEGGRLREGEPAGAGRLAAAPTLTLDLSARSISIGGETVGAPEAPSEEPG